MSEYFPKPQIHEENIKVKIYLSNYAAKEDIKNITQVDASSFALKTNLSNLKTEVDKLDIDKLVTVPTNLGKLSNVVKYDVVKKTPYNKLLAKVDNIDTSDLVLKTKYDTDKAELGKKIPNTSNLATKTALTPIENKIPNISNLATKTLVNKVENRIPNISHLATKAALTTVEDKIPNISNLVKKGDYDTKITSIEGNVNKLQAYDLSYSRGKKYFEEENGKENYLVFLSMSRYFKLNSIVGDIDRVLSWLSKGVSNESIKSPTTSNNSLTPKFSYYNNTRTRVKFKESCLKQSNYIFTHKKIVNIYIVYELGASSSHISDPRLKNCLFGAVGLTKNADIDKYKYSGCGIGIDRR